MKRKSEKTFSTLLASLMAISMVSAAPISVQAKTDAEIQKNQLKQKVRDAYEKNKIDLNSIKVKRNEENLPKENKEDPKETIRIIVETDKDALKDIAPKEMSLKEAAKDKNLINKIDKSISLKEQVKNINPKIKIKKNYSILINGFSAEVQRKDVEKIKELQGVKHVSIVKKYYPDMANSKSLTEAEKAWNDLGYKGEGMVVSIIDTGIDWTHKDMKISSSSAETTKLKKSDIEKIQESKGRWYSEKVPYGYNFADDNSEVIDKTDSMHGMHVAGIVGANCQSEDEIKQNIGVKGVAPEAQLLAMKVFSNDLKGGGAFSDDIVAAIEDSVKHGADVINMSLGSTASFQDPNDAEQKAIKEAVDRGTSVIVSAGNSQYALAPIRIPGVNDTGLVGSPGLAEDSLQVASFENTKAVFTAMSVKIGEENSLMPYTTSEVDPVGVLEGDFEVVDCGLGKAADFSKKDLQGKIALIQRGGSTFIEKKKNAQFAKAKGVIVYNAEGDESFINMATDPAVKIPSIFVKYSDGAKLKTAGAKVSFGDKKIAVDSINAKDMSDFTSWGPTPNLDFKPEITAPGGQIWSTVNNNKYENMSGTSMSSPHMAGSMALIRQHVNKLESEGKIQFNDTREKVEFTKKLAVNTAKVMLEKDQEKHKGIPYSPRRQGAGMVNIPAAINNKVTVEYKENGKPVVALKEIGSEKQFTLKLHNYGENSVTYNVKSLNDNVLTEMDEVSEDMSYDTLIPASHVIVNKDTITVEPGKDEEVAVTIKMGAEAKKNSFAEGFINFKPTTKENPELGVPFMGFYGNWNEMPAVDAPMWKENVFTSIIGNGLGTTLVSPKEDGRVAFLGYMGEGENENPIIDENKIAISSQEFAYNNVAPVVSPLRNIKELKVQVVDANEKVVRNIATESCMRKVVLGSEGEQGFRFNENWTWDGKTYNTSTGKYEVAPDGEYKIRLASKIDYDKAQYQNLDMKVKMDSKEPEVKILTVEQDKDNQYYYTVKFKAEETGKCNSGVEAFAFLINGKIYEDINGNNVMTNLEKDANGNYTAKLVYYEPITNVAVGAFDYAGNIGINAYEYNGQVFGATFMQNGKPVENIMAIQPGNLDMAISVNPMYMDQLGTIKVRFGVRTLERFQVEEGKTQYNYTIKDILPGKNIITISGTDKDGYPLGDNKIIIYAQDENLKVEFDDLQSGMGVSKTEYVVEGSLTALPDEFTINGEPVTDIKEPSITKGYRFSHAIKFEPNKMNKVKVYYRKGEEEQSYAYNVLCDADAPDIILNAKNAVISAPNEVTIKVPNTTEKYKLDGTVKDAGFGYEFFINGESVHRVSTDIPDPKKTTYNFEKEFDLSAATTILKLEARDDFDNVTTKTVKIVKEDESSLEKLYIEPINMKNSYKNGEQFKGGIRVKNTTNEAKSVTLIVGIFDENNKMVNINLATQVIGQGGVVDMSSICTIPSEGNYSIRCFVWDSVDFMRPLSEIIKIPVIK